jgi:hypothetical protein
MIDPYPVDLGPAPRIADPRCGFRPHETLARCNAPATWHVAWTLDPTDARFSLICALHMALVDRNLVYVDRHPASVDCDMPGFGWQIAQPSRCVPATTEDVPPEQQRGER